MSCSGRLRSARTSSGSRSGAAGQSADAASLPRGRRARKSRCRRRARVAFRDRFDVVTSSHGSTDPPISRTRSRHRKSSRNVEAATSSASGHEPSSRRACRNTRSRCRSNRAANACASPSRTSGQSSGSPPASPRMPRIVRGGLAAFTSPASPAGAPGSRGLPRARGRAAASAVSAPCKKNPTSRRHLPGSTWHLRLDLPGGHDATGGGGEGRRSVAAAGRP